MINNLNHKVYSKNLLTNQYSQKLNKTRKLACPPDDLNYYADGLEQTK